jgi:Photoprotection regulator fluorescence recovery protein
MKVNETIWSETEQQIAQNAFKAAYQRETSALITDIREHASQITELEDIWRLHDFLSARRHTIDGKYDYDQAALLFVFAGLVKEGWLKLEDLQGLDPSKLAKIAAIVRMS